MFILYISLFIIRKETMLLVCKQRYELCIIFFCHLAFWRIWANNYWRSEVFHVETKNVDEGLIQGASCIIFPLKRTCTATYKSFVRRIRDYFFADICCSWFLCINYVFRFQGLAVTKNRYATIFFSFMFDAVVAVASRVTVLGESDCLKLWWQNIKRRLIKIVENPIAYRNNFNAIREWTVWRIASF